MPDGTAPGSFLARELRPEALLLLCCARSRLRHDDAERIRALASRPLDWQFLCDSADKHRLTQLLYRHVSSTCPELMPAEPRARLRYQFYANGSESLRLAHALTGLLRTFASGAVPVIPFKGSILANCTYGKLALRQNYDLDLFIREQDFKAADVLLAGEGYHCDRIFDREARYRRAAGGPEVDLHWGFAPRFFHLEADFGQLYRRARHESLMGQAILTFSAEDLLVILCLQVIKDAWERRQQLEHLSKICDIAEHLRAHPDLDWPRVMENARKDGLLRVMHCSLILATGLLGAELPLPVLREIERDRGARRWARWLCRSLFTEVDTMSPLENPYFSMGLRLRQLAFYLGMRERFHDRFRHLGEILRFWRRS